MSQMDCILGVLEKFCLASGQRKNVQKTNVFFSRNVESSRREELLCKSGFSAASGLGRYLGAIPCVGRSKKDSYKDIVQRMSSKLAGWKSSCLSMARRVTLAHSVLGAMSYYHMQYARLPISVCRDMERMQREFFWGSNPDKRKCHLIRWEVIYNPKYMGGLGMKSLNLKNGAFLFKLGWRILNNPNHLWVMVIKESMHGIKTSGKAHPVVAKTRIFGGA